MRSITTEWIDQEVMRTSAYTADNVMSRSPCAMAMPCWYGMVTTRLWPGMVTTSTTLIVWQGALVSLRLRRIPITFGYVLLGIKSTRESPWYGGAESDCDWCDQVND